jgi:DNA polymerase-1
MQTPRDPFVRGVIGAERDYRFVTADYSQVEFRIGAWLANEQTALHLYATGGDVHLAMACTLTGLPPEKITKEQRKRAKWINFGFLFAMGWKTFIETVWRGYQIKIPEEEARASRRLFFQQFPGFVKWHEECRRFVRSHGYVRSPLGRVRHLPNIRSSNPGIRAEAERQAINSPVQSFASDLNLWSALIVSEEAKRLSLRLRILGTVHDETLYEIHKKDVRRALPLIHSTMENLPLQRVFGLSLSVPLVANLTCAKHWTDGQDLSIEEIYDWKETS